MKQKILLLPILLLLAFNNVTYGQDLPDNIVETDCFTLPPTDVFEIRELPYQNTVTDIHTYFIPIVGDIDDDDIPEIIVTKAYASYRAKDILVVDGSTGSIKQTLETPTMETTTNHAIYKVDGETYLLIPVASDYSVAADQLYLYAYRYDKTDQKFVFAWKSDSRYTAYTSSSPSYPAIADLDADGTPEIVIGNCIFNAKTGVKLANFPSGASSSANVLRSTIGIADFLKKGTQQLVMNGKLYSVQFANKNGLNTNAFTLERTAPSAHDRSMAIADFNMDGYLDVLIVGTVSNSNAATSSAIKYGIWDIYNNRLLGGAFFTTATITTTGGYSVTSSVPLIGDVNGDGMLDFVFMTYNMLYCYTYNPSTDKIELYWTHPVADSSGMTGITLFDFNQDKKAELIYRDESRLWLFDGSQKNLCKEITRFTGIRSGTGAEYPTVADVNNDGAAEIITIGSSSPSNPYGTLYILGATEGKRWAPARKVWNQYAYNVVNINEDLTVPRFQFNPATVFAGDDEVIDGNDVYPFNNFLQQQTTLNQHGTPLWTIPKGEIVGTPTVSYNEYFTKMTITLQVRNTGEAQFENPFYVSVFKDAVGSSTSYTYEYQNTIDIGETVTLTLVIDNFDAAWTPYDFLIIKINAKADGVTDQEVCGEDNTLFIYYDLGPTQQEACKDNINEMESSFSDSPYHSYQWQYSADGLKWTDIAGANSKNYKPVYQKPGTGYYRIKVIGSNNTYYYTRSVKVISKPCVMPVNPNIHIWK